MRLPRAARTDTSLHIDLWHCGPWILLTLSCRTCGSQVGECCIQTVRRHGHTTFRLKRILYLCSDMLRKGSPLLQLKTPRSWSLLEKLPVVQLPKSFPFLWNPKVHYRIRNSSPPVPILSQTYPVHITPSHLSKIHPNIMHPPTSWSS
jgi:hypothetical protein